jgi:serine/threonine protein kinase
MGQSLGGCIERQAKDLEGVSAVGCVVARAKDLDDLCLREPPRKRSSSAQPKQHAVKSAATDETAWVTCSLLPDPSGRIRPLNTPVKQEFVLTGLEAGSGSTSVVRLAYLKNFSGPEEERLIALKMVSKHHLSETRARQLFQEVSLHRKMQHPNIARLIRVCEGPCFLNIATEYCSGGCLTERLRNGRLPEASVARVVTQVLDALRYCHGHPVGKVCHRDIKHTNILYARLDAGPASVKLIDFGLACVLSSEKPWLTGRVGTIGYMAPELAAKERYDESCDLFSLGVVAHSLLCGKYPYEIETFHRYVMDVTVGPQPQATGPAWTEVGREARDFVLSLLTRDPLRRPSASRALQHPWLEAFQDICLECGSSENTSTCSTIAEGKDVEMASSTCTLACSADAEDTCSSTATATRPSNDVTPRLEVLAGKTREA